MKIREKYCLVINDLLNTAIVKRNPNINEVSNDSIVSIWDCNLSDLKYNIKILRFKNMHIMFEKK